jgi:hypothetical protein
MTKMSLTKTPLPTNYAGRFRMFSVITMQGVSECSPWLLCRAFQNVLRDYYAGRFRMFSVITMQGVSECSLWLLCREFQNVLRHYYAGPFRMFSVITMQGVSECSPWLQTFITKKTKGPTLMELFTATGKIKIFFFTTRDVRCVHHGWHGTHRYDIQVLATHASTQTHRYSYTYTRIA